jgi:hypothetical protein
VRVKIERKRERKEREKERKEGKSSEGFAIGPLPWSAYFKIWLRGGRKFSSKKSKSESSKCFDPKTALI